MTPTVPLHRPPVGPDAPARVVPYAGLAATPWRNGGGLTRVVARLTGARDPAHPVRLSIASIDASGPFSTHPGVDRVLVVAGRTPVVLTVDGTRAHCSPGDVLPFRGESAVRAEVAPPGATVLNVMTTRGHASATVRTERLTGETVFAGAAAVVVLQGSVSVRGGGRIDELDTVLPHAGPCLLRSTAALVAVVRLG